MAVYVATEEPTVIWCDCDPLSDQPVYVYCAPFRVCGLGADRLWVLPVVHWKEQGLVQAPLSTFNESPGGLVVMNCVTVGWPAVTDKGIVKYASCVPLDPYSVSEVGPADVA